MGQLLAGGFIALGLCIIALIAFVVSQEKKAQGTRQYKQDTQKGETLSRTHTQPNEPSLSDVEKTDRAQVAATVAQNTSLEQKTGSHVVLVPVKEPLPEWWHEQLQSLTEQLQYLRGHTKDVERQIDILGEIAELAGELETLQKKRPFSSDGKPLLFPLKINRQPTDGSYLTDKRPAVRKYTIKAI